MRHVRRVVCSTGPGEALSLHPGRPLHAPSERIREEMYAVVACPRCRRAKVVEPGRKQSSCGLCARTLHLQDLRAFATVTTLEEAQAAAGLVNARLMGREREFHQALAAAAPPVVRAAHDDRYAAAAAAARHAKSEKDRADAVARALDEFSEEDLARGFQTAGLRPSRVEQHLKRMLATDVVFEPRPARYKAF